jgi:hypothetical protein
MPQIDPQPTVATLLAHWLVAFVTADVVQAQKREMEERLAALNARMSDCQAGLRVFGYDTARREDWSRLWAEHREAAERLIGVPHAASTTRVAADAPPAPYAPKVKDLVLARLEAAGETGTRSGPIHDWIAQRHRMTLHPKTVGMTLYRLARAGRARRAGQTWFFVPREAGEGMR